MIWIQKEIKLVSKSRGFHLITNEIINQIEGNHMPELPFKSEHQTPSKTRERSNQSQNSPDHSFG